MSKKSLFWLLGIGLLTFLTLNAGWGEIKQALVRIDLAILLFLCGLQVLTRLLLSYQWNFLIRKKEGQISFGRTFFICQAGKFIESVTPSSKLGGEAAKIYLFRQQTGLSYEGLTSLTLTHKYLTLLPFLLIAGGFIMATSFSFSLPGVVYWSLLIFGIAIILFLGFIFWQSKNKDVLIEVDDTDFVFWEKLKSILSFFQRAAANSRGIITPSEQGKLFLISAFFWFLYPVKIYLAASSLGFEISLVFAALATYSAYLVSMLPLTPGGLGTFEGTMALVFSFNQFLFAEGLAVALVARLVTFWFPLLLSAITSSYLMVRTNLVIFKN